MALWTHLDPSRIDTSLDCRAVTFENPTGARGAGGTTHEGRKGAPARVLAPGEKVVLADLRGTGTVRHVWMTFPPAPPEVMRAITLEVFYEGSSAPSISVPCLDFFGLPHGRPLAYDSALTSVHEGRGFNAYFPMPFRKELRVELTNQSARRVFLFYQIDYTLEPSLPEGSGYLHASFRRENPTQLKRDFTIEQGLVGPGRFLGCCVGIRVLDEGAWYGEGELKVYRDGDAEHPTLCGTGLEDYVGSAWGLGAYASQLAGSPLQVGPPPAGQTPPPGPEFVGFYRWHLPDPIVYSRDLRVTIQQIGYAIFQTGQEAQFERYSGTHSAAGQGWDLRARHGVIAQGIAERVDDYCATSFVYCREPQAVPRLELKSALADIERRPYEKPLPLERVPFGLG